MTTGTIANPVRSGLDGRKVPQPHGPAIPEELVRALRAEAERRQAAQRGAVR